jgi:hypothetical protein
MHEANPQPPSIPNNGRTFWSAIGWQVLGLLLCGFTLMGIISVLSHNHYHFELDVSRGNWSQSLKIPKAGAPWLNLSLLALSVGVLVLFRTLYLFARRKKRAVDSMLLATKATMVGAIMLFTSIDWFSSVIDFEFLSLVMMAYAGITYRIYSSPGKLHELLNKD